MKYVHFSCFIMSLIMLFSGITGIVLYGYDAMKTINLCFSAVVLITSALIGVSYAGYQFYLKFKKV